MEKQKYSDIAVTLNTYLLKFLGLWEAKNPEEQRRRKFAFAYTKFILFLAVFIETRDLYYSRHDFENTIYVCCNVLSIVTVLVKVFVVSQKKVAFFKLMRYMEEKFWNANYDPQEKLILADCKRVCVFFVLAVSSIGQCAIFGYIITPIVANISNNQSERILLFNLWVEAASITPYYEIMFAIEVMGLYYVGLCYYSFDNSLCIINIHLAGQFRILQYRLEKLCQTTNDTSNQNIETVSTNHAFDSYDKFKDCVRQHQDLIEYAEKVEYIFTNIIFAQVLIFSLLICLFGYQVFLAHASRSRRLIFIFLICGSTTLLLMFTYSCHCLIEQSDKVGIAAYSSPWTLMPMTRSGRKLRYDLMMMIIRARRVCCLTANGFFPVSLETYTSILSTAVSYFTLLRQSIEE